MTLMNFPLSTVGVREELNALRLKLGGGALGFVDGCDEMIVVNGPELVENAANLRRSLAAIDPMHRPAPERIESMRTCLARYEKISEAIAPVASDMPRTLAAIEQIKLAVASVLEDLTQDLN